MRKSIINVFAMLLVAGVAFVSCSKESSEIESPSKGYKVSIPANKISSKAVADGGTATFKTTENVYVCNTSNGNAIDANVLHPSANAASANFDGTLAGSYAEGNNLKILYNTNASGVADYSSQNGTIEGVVDAGVATVSVTDVSGGTITTGTASIDNLQSIFKFSFRISTSPDVYLEDKVRFVRIFSTQGKLLSQYNAVTGSSTYGPVTISRDEDLPEEHPYVYAALRFDSNPGDEIVFQVVTNDGKVYSGSKTAPSGGFENGKFYTSTVNVNLYTFTISSPGSTPIKKAYISPGDLGVDNSVYSFTEPFTNWGYGTNKQSDAGWSKRVWFDFGYTASCPVTVYGIDNWRVGSKFTGSTAYEWNYIFGRTNMNENVAPWYKVTIEGHGYCLLLPPDETELTDSEKTELESGSIGSNGYIKYLGKGFVLLMSAGRATFKSNKISNAMEWNKTGEGWYWASNFQSNRTYFSWTSSADPACNSNGTGNLRMHARLFKDVQ